MGLTVLFANKYGTCIVKVRDDLYYYGDGKGMNMYGKSPMKFLRFNPYLDYVENEGREVPKEVADWIAQNEPEDD